MNNMATEGFEQLDIFDVATGISLYPTKEEVEKGVVSISELTKEKNLVYLKMSEEEKMQYELLPPEKQEQFWEFVERLSPVN